MTPTPQTQDPALFEVMCAKEWFEKYGAQAMKGYFEARISAYNRIEKEKVRSHPTPSLKNPCKNIGYCDVCENVNCKHSKVSITAIAAQAREKVLDEFKWMKPSCFGKYNADCDTKCAWVVRERCIKSLRGKP